MVTALLLVAFVLANVSWALAFRAQRHALRLTAVAEQQSRDRVRRAEEARASSVAALARAQCGWDDSINRNLRVLGKLVKARAAARRREAVH